MNDFVNNPGEARELGEPDAIVISAGAGANPDENRDIDPITGLLIQNRIGNPPAGPITVKNILVRRIEIGNSAKGPFEFVDNDLPKPFMNGLLDTIIDQLRAGTYSPGGAANGGGPDDGPLDVHCDGTTTFVFALVEPGDGRRFRFSRSTRAISLGGVPQGEQPNYFTLLHVGQDGSRTELHHANQDCRIAYFTANQTSQNFHHAFNLHVEIVYPTAAGGEYPMPIVIDPDVRYPGGTGEP